MHFLLDGQDNPDSIEPRGKWNEPINQIPIMNLLQAAITERDSKKSPVDMQLQYKLQLQKL
jgi:hypothetical protein